MGGNTLRIAGLLTLLTDDMSTVSEKTMLGAIELAKRFKAHELRLMGGDGELSLEANEALAYLVRRGGEPGECSEHQEYLAEKEGIPEKRNA